MASAYGNQVTNELNQMFSPENVMANRQRQQQVQQENTLASIMQKHQGNVDAALPEIAQVSPEYAFKVDAMRKAQAAAQAQANKPVSMAAGGVLFDPVKREPIYTAPMKPEKEDNWREKEQLRFNNQRQLIELNNRNKQSQQFTQKPIPATALKMQQEELDAIGSASSLNKDLGAFTEMIDSGKLPLGMFTNLNSKIQNLTGYSTPESRNYASFQANLERLRNESLRLNKGVQTEGDAVRAWNEILANINDPKLVSQRLKEVQKVNERAISLRKMNVDAIRSNYGKDPLDVSGRENVPSAYGSGGDDLDSLLNLYK